MYSQNIGVPFPRTSKTPLGLNPCLAAANPKAELASAVCDVLQAPCEALHRRIEDRGLFSLRSRHHLQNVCR